MDNSQKQENARGGGNENILDSTRMQDLLEGLGEDGLRDVIDSYLEDSPRMMKEMQAAYERGDWEDLTRLAHSLRSSSAIFGAASMMNQSRVLEIAARKNDARSAEVIQALPGVFEEVRAVLNLYLHT